MNRREFLANAAMLAAATAAVGCRATSRNYKSEKQYLNVILDGPFILKVNQKANQIYAFTPWREDHEFWVNRSRRWMGSNDLHFWIDEGVVPYNQPADSFEPFTTKQPCDSMPLAMMSCELPYTPCIKYQTYVNVKVIVGTGSEHTVMMPTNHILVYGISNPAKAVLKYGNDGGEYPKPGADSGYWNFELEAGLPNGTPDDGGAHTKAVFADLVKRCDNLKLTLTEVARNESHKHVPGIEDRLPAIDVNCKNGGLISFQ